MKHLEGRKREIAGAYKAVDDTRTEMERLRAEYQERLTKIEAEARGRIQDTVKEAQHQREAIIADARAQAEEIMRDGSSDIEIERIETLTRMRGTLDAVALNALSKSIGSDSTPIHRELVDEYIKTHVARS